ncbi:hypothetical protein [Acidovorax sp. BLS4]|uniref:hypothetical protein n=1 Tax=Acidovorax sp. BLS4 TaxID=3273430 RepID=UPI002942F8F4|nr:hypothetical protein [Paracidovorax avenae]WOI43802.1 hypothetical protein R1Z03_14780 [Paracidovorax avenae]
MAITPEQRRALAIVAMGPTRYEYNLGVLSMLGHEDLAIAHQMVSASVDLARQQLDAEQSGNPGADTFEGLMTHSVPRSARQVVLRAELDAALLRQAAAWSHIEHIIEQHRPLADGLAGDWLP